MSRGFRVTCCVKFAESLTRDSGFRVRTTSPWPWNLIRIPPTVYLEADGNVEPLAFCPFCGVRIEVSEDEA